MAEPSDKQTPNRLIHATSPYLLQHAYNPVDWYPWGEDALRHARESNRPIFLSIGYSACHWCHVMERESFENPDIASLLNERFVPIKVDREERPDLDEIYMQATLALNQGQGGWPMSVFLTPEQEPFFAGTYFPPTDRWGRPGFASLLKRISEVWRDNADGLRQQASHLTTRLRQGTRVTAPTAVGETELAAAVKQFAEEFDHQYGGFGSAPKFPPATALAFLLRRYQHTKDEQILTMVRRTLDAMAAGGMYDHIGGGFARYSTDERWLVPHFEKMLYDNALLARVYLEGWQVTHDPAYRRVAVETLDYILREMTAPDGGFYSATDADSEGVEGKFFVWTPDEIRAAVTSDEDARHLCAYYDITAAGNWEHKSIPNTPRPLTEVADALGVDAAALRRTLDRVKPLVYEARTRRIPPGLDDKIVAAWNGLMITAMAEGGRILGETRYLAAAARAAEFLLTKMSRPDNGLYRTSRNGVAQAQAVLEDYASLAEGLLDLYEAGGQTRHLTEAVRLAERMLADFTDTEQGGFFTTARDHETLILRSREGPDGATPSGNAVAASVLARLSYHTDREDFRQAAAEAVRVYGRQIARYPRAFAKSLMVASFLLEGPVELALVGTLGEAGFEALRAAVNRIFVANRILAHFDPQEGPSTHPLLIGKGLVQGQPALYVCRNYACQAPITAPAGVEAALSDPPPATHQASQVLSAKRLPGHATPAGTGTFVGRTVARGTGEAAARHGYGPLGSTGLTVSRVGFGGYRIGTESPEHQAALIHALREGCNLVDTSTNYTDGESERLVGSVLAELVRTGRLTRDQIVVVSKVGYVQGQTLTRAREREQAGQPYPDMVKYGDGLWHCLHPTFLAEQLDLMLDRLGLETLDVLLLHNPEYFLSHAKRQADEGQPVGALDDMRARFYQRLRSAFAYLESQVAAGRLRHYGVSSNTSVAPPDNADATSLSEMLAMATRAAQDAGQPRHHFAVVQCPMNLFEAGAFLIPNTGADQRQTLLEFAAQAGTAVLVNRPLNAMPPKGQTMFRLASPAEPSADRPVETSLQQVRTLEEEYRREIAPSVPRPPEGLGPEDYFRWADELASICDRVHNLQHWEQIEEYMIAPHVNQVLQALPRVLSGEPAERWENWRDRYVPEFLSLLRSIRATAADKSRTQADAIHRAIGPHLPPDRQHESLSRLAIWTLASTPGVTCVLTGMRTPSYVDDALAILSWKPLTDCRPIYQAVSTLQA